MSTPRGDRGIADVIRSWRLLRADERDLGAIAHILGFDLRVAAGPVEPVSRTRSASAISVPGPAPSPRPPARDPARPRRSVGIRKPLSPAVQRPVLAPAGYEIRVAAGAIGEGLAAEPRPDAPASHPHRPLFVDSLTPSLITAIVATDAGDGPIDVERLVRRLAARRFPRSLPVQPRPSLFRGVQLLIDVGAAMTPFRRDAATFSELAAAVVGRTAVQRRFFADTPLEGIGPGARWTWSDRYVPPDQGTPVLVVTELGIGGPASHGSRSRPEQWMALADILHRRGSPVVALVPYPRRRWPPELVGRLPMVAWDRGTTLTDVRSAVGAVLGGRRG